jgi:very-short-patch-repair endonuclease
VTRQQLIQLGYCNEAIRHRLAKGRLHRVRRGVYAVGRPGITQHASWLAAVLSCGPEAVLSHGDAGRLLGICPARAGLPVEVSVPARVRRRRPGIVVHRRTLAPNEITVHDGIPVTAPAATLVDLATTLSTDALVAAVNEADKLDLIDPERLRQTLDEVTRRPGLGRVRAILDRRTFTLTESKLERRFLSIAREAGLEMPETGAYLNGYKVDFYWPALGLVIETDGLRYHRTPAQQGNDRQRDQAHAAAGLTPLRFTHAQVAYERAHVKETIAAVAKRLRGNPPTVR